MRLLLLMLCALAACPAANAQMDKNHYPARTRSLAKGRFTKTPAAHAQTGPAAKNPQAAGKAGYRMRHRRPTGRATRLLRPGRTRERRTGTRPVNLIVRGNRQRLTGPRYKNRTAKTGRGRQGG